eukprot:TRINITY_DN42874_c0_g1_i1.p1 TRINITY_DN42874_c0_g1~~TRINITY_DN42874_c0_g1_i1.p1  ORF type:complete len:480 (+),score=165.18 TRINITY_DN42874_c0_g1_i1:69-1442(+)
MSPRHEQNATVEPHVDDIEDVVSEDKELLGSEGTAASVGHAGSTRTAVSLTKCFVGAASFELPWAFMHAGWGGAVIGIILLCFLSGYSLTRLAKCGGLAATKEKPTPTYPDIGYTCFGRKGYAVSWFGVIAMTLGVCGSYLLFISHTMPKITGWGTKIEWLLLIIPVVSALACLRTVHLLAWTNGFGVLALIFAVAVTIADCLKGGGRWKDAPDNTDGDFPSLTFWRWDTYMLFLGNAAYLYLISTAIVPVAQSMARPERFARPYIVSAFGVTIANIGFALVAWAAYGDCPDGSGSGSGPHHCTKGNVVDNLPDGGTKKAVQALLCTDLLFTCVVFLFPFTQALEREMIGVSAIAEGGCFVTAQRNALRFVCVCLIAVVAAAVPSFELLTGLTGGFGNNILGIILPPLFYWKLQPADYWTRQGMRLVEEAVLAFTFFCGVCFLIMSTETFMQKIIEG